MAIHSSILAWKVPWTEEAGRPHSMGQQRVGHERAHTYISHFLIDVELTYDIILASSVQHSNSVFVYITK